MQSVLKRSNSRPAKMTLAHQPVLYHEIIHALGPTSGGRYIDGTLGAGGHAAGILNASSPDGLLLGLDVDPDALTLARQNLTPFGERAFIRQASYTTLRQQMSTLGWQTVNGILLDLGASSLQFDNPERGFSFLGDGPLDMRFNPEYPFTAASIVNSWSEADLADVIYRYGEEPASRRIARAIVRKRPFTRTKDLAALIEQTIGRRGGHHPATRTFQALRIAVNEELEAITDVLPLAMQALETGGRLAIISFHSLEDRLVKETFRQESRDCLCPPTLPICTCGHKATLKEVSRRPIVPCPAEVQENPRSRSAKLRVAEKL